MTVRLDRADIQGHVLLPYGRNTFPIGHLLLFHLQRGDEAVQARQRRWLAGLLPRITTSELFDSKRTRSLKEPSAPILPPPRLTVNAAFTCAGLAAFGVPATTLRELPPEFQQGMRARAALLHDDVTRWDPVWQEGGESGRIDLMLQLRVNFALALRRAYALAGQSDAWQESEGFKACFHQAGIFDQARRLAFRRLERYSSQLIASAEAHGLRCLRGHGRDPSEPAAQSGWQVMESLRQDRPRAAGGGGAAEALADDGQRGAAIELESRYCEVEHFGFFDGIGDPVFEGQYPPELETDRVIGQGRLVRGSWQPLAAGEFLLGYPDQAQEMPALPVPVAFSRNGTFLVVRKLHQDVPRFERAIDDQLPAFQSWLDHDEASAGSPSLPMEERREQARLLLRAKLVGRWDDGTPLTVASTHEAWRDLNNELRALREQSRDDDNPGARELLRRLTLRLRNVRYEPDDHLGSRCPFTSHIRRSNPRDSGDPTLSDDPSPEERQRASSLLVNRRRILRRGMTYGPRWRPPAPGAHASDAYQDDGQERGTLFMALCTGLSRQFEFMQQQWLNHGSEFGAGNDVCPISGVAAPADAAASKLIIASDTASHRPPFVMRPLPAAVECRGGAYFFVPSLTALRLIAHGMVDPI